MIGKLVDQGKISWDDPLSNHLPTLEAIHKENAHKPTIRHALGHRTGFPAANMLWRSGEFNADEILKRVCLMTPIAAPGQSFLYNNVMYLAVGNAAEQACGKSWSEFIKTELFLPLGMNRSVCHSTDLQGLENVALPHATSDGRVTAVERYCPDVIAPAGSIHSTASDMAQWLILHLEQGRFGGRELLTASRVAEMHSPIETPPSEPHEQGAPRAPISRYGLGWFVNTHAGMTVVEHTGSSTGFLAWMAMMPQERLGVVILSNHHQTGINSALKSWIFDRLLSRPQKDWSTAVRTDYIQGWQRLRREAKARFAAKRPPEKPASLPLSEYAGKYVSDLYGTIHVREKDGSLRLQFGTRFLGELQTWGGDSFRVFFSNPRLDDWLVTFAIDEDKVASLKAQESPWAPEWYNDRDDLGVFKKRSERLSGD
jgi:CubicO group peptidase (beta-lactamase class C family)